MWVAAVSAVLVTQPDLHSSFKASLMRVVANLAGAFGGAALLAATGQPILAMAIGVLMTGLVCYLLKQDDALRPAFVAVIIVTLIGEKQQMAQFDGPCGRRHHRLCVRAGCRIFIRQTFRRIQTFKKERRRRTRHFGIILKHETFTEKQMGAHHRRIERVWRGGGDSVRRGRRETSARRPAC